MKSELDDIEITLWVCGHHSGGVIKHLYVFVEEGEATAIVKTKDAGNFREPSKNEIMEGGEFTERRIEHFDIETMLKLLTELNSNPLLTVNSFRGFGSNLYGLKIETNSFSTTYQWLGKGDSLNESISNLYVFMREL